MIGAALLNLTGLSLGYAYLGRWVRGAVHLAVTAALVAVAILTGLRPNPGLWTAVAVLWLTWMALDGVRLAHRTPAPERAAVPILVGAVAVAALVAGYVAYGVAGHAAYTRGTDAMGRGYCAAATSAFDQVTGLFALAANSDVAAAGDRRAECDLFTAAAGTPDAAARVDAYEEFRRDHALSPLQPVADENLADARLEAVDADRALIGRSVGKGRAARVRTDVETLLSVSQGLPTTRAAARVRPALDAVYAAAAEGTPCNVLPSVEYVAELQGLDAAAIAGKAKAQMAGTLLSCGLDEFRIAAFAGATAQLTKLVSGYPDDPGVPQARSALIAAKVAARTTDPIPLPAPAGRPGSLRVTFFNVTASPLKVSVTGTSAAEVDLPGCAGCPESHVDSDPCPESAGKPSAVVQVDPGLYHVLLDSGLSNGGQVRTLTPVPDDFFCVYRSQA